MNINKLFKHLSIQAKLMIAFILLSTIPLLLVGGYGIHSKISSLKEIAVRNVNHDVTTIREKIAGFLSHVENDLRFLADSYHFRNLIRAMEGTDEATIELLLPMVKEEFLTFLQSKKIYYQIRYLDEIGEEIFRISFDGIQAEIVTDEQLSQIVEERYFWMVSSLTQGQMVFVPAELKRSESEALVPAISYAMPVFTPGGGSKGILIVNLFADFTLSSRLCRKRFFLPLSNSFNSSLGFSPLWC